MENAFLLCWGSASNWKVLFGVFKCVEELFPLVRKSFFVEKLSCSVAVAKILVWILSDSLSREPGAFGWDLLGLVSFILLILLSIFAWILFLMY